MTKACSIVTIKSFSPMYKEGEEASNIQIVNLEENGFDIVTQKGLYEIGDKALYIQPDFCLSDIPLFESFLRPDGNSNKSKLGKHNRIKAIKFNFTNTKGDKVFSNGILLPINEVYNYLAYSNSGVFTHTEDTDFDALLGIIKYEEPEGKLNGDAKGNLPKGMYKTDETNFHNNYKQLEELLPCKLVGTEKIDGSSCTVYWKDENTYGICSRGLEKQLSTKAYEGFRKHFDKEKGIRDWTNGEVFVEDIDQYFKDNNLPITEVLANDDWVQLGYPILEKLKEYGKPLVVRCEIYGQALKGSGNKNNPHAKLPKSIAIYGIDDYSTGICVPLPMKDMYNLGYELGLHLNLINIAVFCNGIVSTIEEIKITCDNCFKDKLIEGIVIRTWDTNEYSGKYMNPEYDSLK